MITESVDTVNSSTLGRRQAVLRILQEAAGPLRISDIAERLAVHPNTVRFHLVTLLEIGRVERVDPDRRSPGRPPQLFRSVRSMDSTGPRRYLLLAEVLLGSLATEPSPAGRAAAAGRAWGRQVATMSSDPVPDADPDPDPAPVPDDDPSSNDSVGQLLELLGDLDFSPELRAAPGQRQIGLRHCPFLELARKGAAAVCTVHLGIMQGAMQAWRSPLTVGRLDPFVEPDLCLAHLTTAGAS